MQKVLAAALAVPILVLVYAGTLIRRVGGRQAVMALVAIGLISALIATAVHPTPATGTLPLRHTAVDPAEFTTIVEAGESPSAPIVISFADPMNTASVERLVRISPVTSVIFSWDVTATLLTIAPREVWAMSTLHTVTVEAGALDATGRPLAHRIGAAFLTRAAVAGTISASETVAATATATSHFRLVFSGPVKPATINVVFDPAIAGHIVEATDGTPAQPAFTFIPDQDLPPGITLSVRLAPGARDADGGAIEVAPLTIDTAAVPRVVRFRPRAATTGVGWSQNLSVRFTESMTHATTEKAWSATQAGKVLAGSFAWAENDTVLVFNPKAVLGYSQKVTLVVGIGATSTAGLALAAPATATFTTARRPISGSSGGGTIGSSTWSAVEAYYLKLMNCTRTGGLVTSTGSCSSPGGRNVAPLWQDAGISAKVSRPYARKLAVNNLCTHFSGGTAGGRLRVAGYTSYIWAENLGCRSGDPYTAVLGSHLYFQGEASYNGGHYVNLMNAAYDRVGIGVWVSAGRVRLVIDFYRPA